MLKVLLHVVVLARPASRSEGGLRKKLQSSLEAQIRFLIKKCRTLSGSELSHSGPRSGGTSTSAPLFSLDASRAVVLLDWFSNQRCESLDFAAGLVEDVLNGKATSDSLLLESHGQIASKEDIISVKEFIYRQSDILRGRGGIANSNSGSATGVGMVAVAAAAAAASAASGKTYTTPELPTLEVWLSSSNHILYGVLSAKGGCLDEIEFSRRKHRPRNTVPAAVEGSVKGADPLDIAVSWLQSGRGLNTKFSTLWCERAVPVAKEVYLKDLPARYPTSLHESHLAKALHAFHSMVRGPAVQLFAKKLEDECTSIWKSGRQLCDAVSLTGKPCMHQRHDIDIGESDLGASAKPHSSGYFFLHACACGRSRRLRSDPFDFESANISSSWFQECDKLLPALKLPEISTGRPIQHFSWSLLRIGGARYYEPAKGLLQSGFCATEKFLLKWTIYLEKQKNLTSLAASTAQQGSMTRPPRVELHADTDVKRTNSMQSYPGDLQNGVKEQRTSLDTIKSDDKNISFGRGLPNFKMRKPFSEVVAGSATTDSAFPPLQHRKLPSSGSYKGIKHSRTRDGIVEGVHAASSQQIGSNMVPVYTNGGEMVKSHSLKNVTVYVGFEHECPHGHRFLLSPEHLNDLGSSYSLPEECCISSLSDNNLSDTSKVSKSSRRGKVHRSSNGIIATSISKERDIEKSKEKNADGNPYSDGLVYYSGSGKEQNQISKSVSTKISNFVKDLEGELQSISIGDSGSAFSLLNRNLPVYMKCPHCRLSKNKKDPPKVQFAGTISQLQRIFLVTPPFPIILATCPVVQFESSCVPLSVPEREQKLQFSLGCQVVLPPESFLTLRLPFVYGVQLEDRSMHPLNPLEHQPEMTAWITKGTTLQILSKGSNLDEGYQTQ
ncbi:Protein SMG8 [Quillaja saponaria]|uniref:Nonsense-mediated mRNA decay factor SMG8 n=1 Tax=Quillaja saponaria TaxID=32244 RepID=A0AAD7KYB3_QUISA|nr:Protein SMG8 [Quillaja saponaria]